MKHGLKILAFALSFILCGSVLTPSAHAQEAPRAHRDGSIQIDWGDMGRYFYAGSARLEDVEQRDVLGRVYTISMMTFMVEAHGEFITANFYAHFYDEEGVEVDTFSPVEFAPGYLMWQPGMRSRGRVVAPSEETMRRVRVIRFTQL